MKVLRSISLLFLFALTVGICLLIIPSTREQIHHTLFPLYQGDQLTIYAVDTKKDYSNQVVTLKLKLKNSTDSTVPLVGFQSGLQLNTIDGEIISPHTLPNQAISKELLPLEPHAHWKGEFSWWLEPSQTNRPLRLLWLNEEFILFEEEGK